MLKYSESYHLYCGMGCFTLWMFKNRLWLYEWRLKILARTGGQHVDYSIYPDEMAARGKDNAISTRAGFFDFVISKEKRRYKLLEQNQLISR